MRIASSLLSTVAFASAVTWCIASEAVYPQLQSPPDNGNWAWVFREEFDSSVLNKERWTTCYWWNKDGCTNLGNNELQWYLPKNVNVADGQLRLRAQPEPVPGHEGRIFPYTSGMVTTGRDYSELPRPARVAFLYGYFEIRAKVPAGKGLWPALWLLPESRESRPEIDILEVLGDTPDKLRMHFHYLNGDGEKVSVGETVPTSDLSKDWHVYGLRWDQNAIVWYLDGVEQWRFTDTKHIPKERMYLIINLAVGGKWPGDPDEKTLFPADFLIDYVRVWQGLD